MDAILIKPEILVTSIRSNLHNLNVVKTVEYVGEHSLKVTSVLTGPEGIHDNIFVELSIFTAMGEQLLFVVTDNSRTLEAMRKRIPRGAAALLRQIIQPPMQLLHSQPQVHVDSGSLRVETQLAVQLPDCVMNVLLASHAARWAAVGSSLA